MKIIFQGTCLDKKLKDIGILMCIFYEGEHLNPLQHKYIYNVFQFFSAMIIQHHTTTTYHGSLSSNIYYL